MKKVLTLLLLISSVCLFAEDVSIKPAGEGTEESPYLFDCLENFFWLRQQTSEMEQSVPVYCKQTKDIDASATQQGGDYAWSDINFSKNNLFVYDGQEYTIYGLEPNEKGALFGTGFMQLKNIRIQGAEGIKTCALAKNLSSDKSRQGCFKNCHIKGLLVETPALADTVRGMFIKIEDCVVEADIEIKNEETSSGALINFMFFRGGTNSVRKTCFKGKVKTKPLSHVCGLTLILNLGSVYSSAELTIEDCYTDLTVECNPDETVVLLSKGEVDSKKIRVEFSLEDMDMSEFQDGATYTQIKDYVLEHSGLKVSNLYISQIKRKCGIEVGKNYNLPKSEDSRQPLCPPEKEKAIREAFKYFGII